MQMSRIQSYLVVVALLAGAVLIAFGAVLPGEFVVDDLFWASFEPSPVTASEVSQAFGSWGFRDTVLAIQGPPIYRPFQVIFGKLAHLAFGPVAWKFHLLSLFLHLLCGFLLWLLLGHLLPTMDASMRLFAATAFVVHPAGSEAVLWISAMSELTVAAAILGVLLVYFRWKDCWSPARIAGFGVLCLMASLWKETAIVLPLLVLACEWSQKPSGKPFPWLPVAAMFAASLLFLFLRQGVIGSFAGGQDLSINPIRAAELALTHWRFLLLPGAPPFALRPPEIVLASVPAILAAATVLGGIAWWCYRKGSGRIFGFGLAWIALTLWPAYVVALVGDGFFNGRQAYIPAAGVAIMLAALLEGTSPRLRRYAFVAAALILSWMIMATAANALTWNSNTAVYLMAARVSPGADGPRAGIANALEQRGDIPGALARYAEALQRATTTKARAEHLYAMARLHGLNGDSARSNRLLREVIALEPQNSFAWVGLGNNAWTDGRLFEAASWYRKAIEADPSNFEAASNLAGVLAASGPQWAGEASFWRRRAQALADKAKP